MSMLSHLGGLMGGISATCQVEIGASIPPEMATRLQVLRCNGDLNCTGRAVAGVFFRPNVTARAPGWAKAGLDVCHECLPLHAAQRWGSALFPACRAT